MTKRAQSGFTMIEILVALAIISVIALIMGNVVMKTARLTVDTDQRSRADMELRYAMEKIETLLLNANAFQVARSTELIFIADSNTDPNYSPYGDIDADGIINLYDPDDDDDATNIVPSTAQWRIGYDLKDDDENGDSLIDMRWRIRFATATKTLTYDYSRNHQAWGTNEQTLLTNVVSTPVFTFFGSENDLLLQNGATLDANGNNDGTVAANEIDLVANGGNGNFVIDTSTEMARIVTIGVYLDKDDEDGDRTVDSHISIEVMPPPLYLKRRP